MTQQAETSADPQAYLQQTDPRERFDAHRAGGDEAIVIDIRDAAALHDHEPLVDRSFLHHRPGILSAPRWQLLLKRLVDISAAVFFILIFLPLMVVTALAVKLTSPGPILYTQKRVGKDGKIFRFSKFRSMYNGAHEERHAVHHLNEVDGPIFKIKDDPRITPVGRVIRRFSIDELPQFFHVLSGTMSLVGPRPPLPEEVEEYDEWEYQRLLTKPGITCIWQVSGRSTLDFETWVRLDIQYIESWTPWLDMKILGQTVPAVLSARGAY